MSAPSLASAAYDVALAQRDALARRDVDAYLKGVARERHACDALVDAGISTADDAAVVDDLVATIMESQALLHSVMGDTTTRLLRLRAARKAAGAYFNTSARQPLRVREA